MADRPLPYRALIEETARRAGLTCAAGLVSEVLSAFFAAVVAEVDRCGFARVPDVGTFRRVEREARTVAAPPGAEWRGAHRVEAGSSIKFRPALAWRRRA